MARDSVLTRVATGAAVGGAIGGAVGAVYGTYDAIRYKYHLVLPVAESITDPSFGLVPAELGQVVLGMEHPCSIDPRPNFPLKEPIACVPGLLKIRHIGQTTLGSAAVFSLFLAAGTLIRSH
ncbi:hypothetical protein HKD37_04G010461 [Glycine soja]|uniref:Uncharacterized protein n=1 Tax=Glycine soja TaxID=3848 RepID=A0A445L011_GLYSO|nr:hypothetical protein D0Y65_009653 [Glycine soja]